MLGRGLLRTPSLLEELAGTKRDLKRWHAFLSELCDAYLEEFQDGRNTLFKMKELWFYLFQSLPDSEKDAKQMKKTTELTQYHVLVSEIFRSFPD